MDGSRITMWGSLLRFRPLTVRQLVCVCWQTAPFTVIQTLNLMPSFRLRWNASGFINVSRRNDSRVGTKAEMTSEIKSLARDQSSSYQSPSLRLLFWFVRQSKQIIQTARAAHESHLHRNKMSDFWGEVGGRRNVEKACDMQIIENHWK